MDWFQEGIADPPHVNMSKTYMAAFLLSEANKYRWEML